MITSLSPASSQTNVYMTQQQSGFEPFIKTAYGGGQNSSSYSKNVSTTSSSGYDCVGDGQNVIIKKHTNIPGATRHGREEEEEELVNVVTNSPVEMDRQFRPIYKPNESINSTPIAVSHGGKDVGGQKRHNNYSVSSFNAEEYGTGGGSRNG